MLLTMMKAKLHRAKATSVDIDYEGSISIDTQLLAAAGILKHERVDVFNLVNGARFSTYVIEAPHGSRAIGINGAAGHLVRTGDRLIIVAYCQISVDESGDHRPAVVVLSEDNSIDNTRGGRRGSVEDARTGI